MKQDPIYSPDTCGTGHRQRTHGVAHHLAQTPPEGAVLGRIDSPIGGTGLVPEGQRRPRGQRQAR
jgi:hypothetical protein